MTMLSIFKRKVKSAGYYFFKYKNIYYQWISDLIFDLDVLYKFKFIYGKRKIAIGTTFFYKGGVVNHIVGLNKYLKTSNIIIPSLNESIEMGEKEGYSRYMRLLQKKNLISQRIVHSHADVWYINHCHELQKKGAKWVHTYHLPYFEDSHGRLQSWQIEMNKSLFETACHADIKISVAKWEKDYYESEHKIETIYIPNCVDKEKCELANGDTFNLKYGLHDFILFSSNSSYVKNPVEYIRLAEQLPHLIFVMIGNNINYKVLSELYMRKLPGNIFIVDGYLNHEDVLNAVAACKVYVMTSRIEGLPTALLEAMVIGKPVVASDVHGCKEVLSGGEYGYLYTLGNIDQLTEKTLLAINDQTIGEKAKIHVASNYDWKVIAPKIDELYAELLRE